MSHSSSFTLEILAGVKEQTHVEDEVEEVVLNPWMVILYNDDIHTFDEVIAQLMKATGCTLSHAEETAHKVHNDGKAVAFQGSFEECLKVDSVLKEIQLVTEIRG